MFCSGYFFYIFVHQAFKDHKPADLLSDLGSADLTADVDFSLLKRITQREEVLSHGPMTQNEFLHKMGIRQRLDVSICTSHHTCNKNELW